MSEQSGHNESPERPGSDVQGSARSGSDRSGSDRSGSDRSGSDRSGSERQRQSAPASDMLSDLQRWLLRQSAKNVRREIGGQVRRTFGGGRQPTSAADIWDTATTEIPPEVGESPECQWCPICRAARRMREAGPGLGGQLSGAGDAVATVVQDAISAVDSILSKAGGDQRTGANPKPGAPAPSGSTTAGAGRGRADAKPTEPRRSAGRRADADRPAAQGAATRNDAAGASADAEDLHSQAGADHGPGGWKPGDKLATDHVIDPDPWAGATEADDGTTASGKPGPETGSAPQGSDDAQLDGQGNGPDDRG